MKIIRSKISPLGGIMIIMIIVIVFSGASLTLDNYTATDTRRVVSEVNQTANHTAQLAEDIAQVFFSANRTNLIVDEIKETQQIIFEARENRTQQLFNEMDEVLNRTIEIFESLTSGISRQDEIVDNQLEIIRLLRNLTNYN